MPCKKGQYQFCTGFLFTKRSTEQVNVQVRG
ncbi:hypothetical protein FOPG_19235 [Fusarium oxysporum f. sp. conglutinans race 2 54008]|uniref:Uncharacterized protein n=1 Tax=Fusarium oxysporum f. sp. conglutinans race 2 54008 TaxID=1089457 RepID=X0GXC4_FUSOX|nr:hypothetical protein FOPG_19235 [Fusarium oxysporum f. sp. conglutinans race 2 54008]